MSTVPAFARCNGTSPTGAAVAGRSAVMPSAARTSALLALLAVAAVARADGLPDPTAAAIATPQACEAQVLAYGMWLGSCAGQQAMVFGDSADAWPTQGARLAAPAVADMQPATAAAVAPQGAVADARWVTDWGRLALRAGLGADGTRLVSRSFGWQVDDPRRGAALQVGAFVGSRSALLPQLPITGLRYATAAPAAGAASSNSASAARLSDVWSALQLDAPARPLTPTPGLGPTSPSGTLGFAPVTFGSSLPFLGRGELKIMPADINALRQGTATEAAAPATLLRSGGTDFTLEAGRLSDDPTWVDAGRDVVLASSVRLGVTPFYTLSATALRVGPNRLWGTASDMKLGPIGVVRAGVSVLDAGDGGHPRGLIGHDYQTDGFSTRLRLEQRYGSRSETVEASQLSGTQSALADDRHNRAAAASLTLTQRAQLTVAGLDREPMQGESARWLSVGASYRVGPGSQLSVAMQRVTLPEETNRVLVSWQMPLDARPSSASSAGRALRPGLTVDTPSAVPNAPAVNDDGDDLIERAVASAAH